MPELKLLTLATTLYAQRRAPIYRPEALERDGFVESATADEVERHRTERGPLWLCLHVDLARLTAALDGADRVRILGPIDRTAITEVEPLRIRTPDHHTLYGVLTMLHVQGRTGDPALAHRVDLAFAQNEEWLRARVGRDLAELSSGLVNEVVQDTLATAWVLLPSYRPEAKFRTFLWAIARRLCAGTRRRHCNRFHGDGLVDDLPSAEASALERMEKDEQDAWVRQELASGLDPDDRLLVELRYVEDHGYDEIARRTKLDHEDIRVALQRIKRRLRARRNRSG